MRVLAQMGLFQNGFGRVLLGHQWHQHPLDLAADLRRADYTDETNSRDGRSPRRLLLSIPRISGDASCCHQSFLPSNAERSDTVSGCRIET